jgi:putative sterol carrier protein
MAFKFPSDEWVKELSRQLNASPAYLQSGKAWEGDFVFVVEGDERYPLTTYLYLDLFHGASPSAFQMASLDEKKGKYLISAPYSTWRKIIEGKLDPIQGLMMRRLKLQGDLMQVMRYPKAAKDMVDACSQVPTNFVDDLQTAG